MGKNSNLEINHTDFFLIFNALLFFEGIRIGALLGDLEMEAYSDDFDLKVIQRLNFKGIKVKHFRERKRHTANLLA